MRYAGKPGSTVSRVVPPQPKESSCASKGRRRSSSARVRAVDRDLASAEETVAMVVRAGGDCVAFEADVTKEATLAAAIGAGQQRWGRIDILHYNVGVSIAGGDASLLDFTEE